MLFGFVAVPSVYNKSRINQLESINHHHRRGVGRVGGGDTAGGAGRGRHDIGEEREYRRQGESAPGRRIFV